MLHGRLDCCGALALLLLPAAAAHCPAAAGSRFAAASSAPAAAPTAAAVGAAAAFFTAGGGIGGMVPVHLLHEAGQPLSLQHLPLVRAAGNCLARGVHAVALKLHRATDEMVSSWACV